jgi:two-component system, OmpR family, response regulator MtrA
MARILVADDDEDIRMLVVMRLQHSGHEVEQAGDGATAVEQCRNDAPDLVVLDLMMPGMNGLDACRTIRADPALARTPVILLTARAQTSDVEAGLAAGADDYITKPFSPRDLAERVDALLAQGER